ncbi:hypothetical protein RFI_29074, partial [Reticulomyxa filosa]
LFETIRRTLEELESDNERRRQWAEQIQSEEEEDIMYDDDLNVSGTGTKGQGKAKGKITRGQVDKEQVKPFESKINAIKIENLMKQIRTLDLKSTLFGERLLGSHFVVKYHEWKSTHIYEAIETERIKMGESFVESFQKFKKQLFGWHQFVAMDMENAWSLVEDITEDQAHKLGQLAQGEDVKGKVSVQAENVGEKLISYIRLNIALHTNNSMRLNKAYESIATFKNLNLLDDDETMLAFCATPFLGRWQDMERLGDNLIENLRQHQCKEMNNPNLKVSKTQIKNFMRQLPTGFDFYTCYEMCKEDEENNSSSSSINQKFPALSKCLFTSNDKKLDITNPKLSWGWYAIEHFHQQILQVDCGNTHLWLRDYYMGSSTDSKENTFNAMWSKLILDHSIFHKMGLLHTNIFQRIHK